MSPWQLAIDSIKHYRWLSLAVLAGVALTSGILGGSLSVGDSVRASLRQNAASRLGKIHHGLVANDRFFTAALADRVGARLGRPVVPVLQMDGTVSTPAGSGRANQVQVVGVDERFWALAPGPVPEWDPARFAVNEPLAQRLKLVEGASLLVAVEPPGAISRDAPLSGATNETSKIRGKVGRVLPASAFGNYHLNAEQVPPLTVFLPLSRLQTAIEKDERANVLLVGPTDRPLAEADILEALQPGDAELAFVDAGDQWSLQTDRVFLSSRLADRVRQAFPDSEGVLTYLVNAIRAGDRMTPYSMVASRNLEGVPPGSFLASDWLAEDLGVTEGDEVSLEFFTMSRGRKLTEETKSLKVARVDPLEGPGFAATLTPEFPGVSDAENNADWEPGMPFEKDRIRKKDEDYWDDYQTKPKAILNLGDGQAFWENRFGAHTSFLLPKASKGGLAPPWETLRDSLELGDLGWTLRHLQDEAASAVADSYDFGGLFAGMSFFLILAALVLTALLFLFGVEQRRDQIGLLLALGWRTAAVRRALWLEALLVSLFGATAGIALGAVYTRLALWGLGSAWNSAATGMDFVYQATPASQAIAWLAAILLAQVSVWLGARAASRISPTELISGSDAYAPRPDRSWGRTPSFWAAVASLLMGAVLLLVPQGGSAMAKQGAFFGGGFLFVLAGLFGAAFWLDRLQQASQPLRSVHALGRSQALRHRWRSLSVIATTAAGVFMITAINSLRLNAEDDAGRPSSGTGGFAYVAETSLPIYADLNRTEGLAVFGLEEEEERFDVVQFRVNQGEDASCLNLNRAQQPRVLGVDPGPLESRFFFTAEQRDDAATAWDLLNVDLPDTNETPRIPGILDAATAQYALGKKLGDGIAYEAHDGSRFEIQIVGLIDNSLLQGSILISEDHFIRLFPDSGGYRFFLLDWEGEPRPDALLAQWNRQLEDRGIEIVPSWQRLNAFNQVQNTYLSIFSTLGGLGLLLGTIGLGVVVSRNLLERRGQMALLNAVGLSRRQLGRMVVAEHGFLHLYGVLLGVAAGLCAILPTLSQRAHGIPVGLLTILLTLILAGGLCFCWIAARWMLRGEIHQGLRHE